MMLFLTLMFKPFTPDSAKSKIDKFSKITNWVKLETLQLHNKVLLSGFPMNGLSTESRVWKF